MRLAAVISGGYLPSPLRNTSFRGLVHVSDWMPTLCALAGADAHDAPAANATDAEWFWPVDGHNIWPFLTAGSPNPRSNNTPLVLSSPFTSGPGGGAMLVGRMKIVVNAHNDGWDQPPNQKKSSPTIPGNSTCLPPHTLTRPYTPDSRSCLICSVERPCLYDIIADPAEISNLAASQPDTLARLNDTYAALVYHMRYVHPLNFTSENGWDCGDTPINISSTTNDHHLHPRHERNLKLNSGRNYDEITCGVTPPSPQCYRTTNHTIRSFKSTSASECCAACDAERLCKVLSVCGNVCMHIYVCM